MVDSLHKYLILHKKLSLPGIGSLIIQQTNASIDVVSKTIQPPLPVINFSADKHVQQFFLHNMQDKEASMLHHFNSLTENINNNKQALLPGIGSLQKDEQDNITFMSAYSLEDFFPIIIAERIIHKNAAHTMLVGDTERTNIEMQDTLTKPVQKAKDRWVLYAILLAAAGIAALIYYHAVHQ